MGLLQAIGNLVGARSNKDKYLGKWITPQPPKTISKNIRKDRERNLERELAKVRGTATSPSPSPSPYADPSMERFGIGDIRTPVAPDLYDALVSLRMTPEERRNLAELSGHESSYGRNLQNVSDIEESYGPYHINLGAGRISPRTEEPFTKGEAMNPDYATKYARDEYREHDSLGPWNPGDYKFYDEVIPKKARKRYYVRGEE